jgi:hypothetical protein
MTECPSAADAFVAVSFDLPKLVVFDGFSERTVAVQDRLCAVGARSGPIVRSGIDGGDHKIYLHGLVAVLRE